MRTGLFLRMRREVPPTSAVYAGRPPDPNFPLAAQSRSLVHMTVQGEQRLPFLDKPLHCDATDMYIQRNVLISHPAQRRAI
jgi:hypothetical protein